MFAQPIHRLSVAKEDYIRSISKLSKDLEPVTISALASSMGVTSPSVSGMIQRLEQEGLVEHLPRTGVLLTPEGQKLALNIHRRHRLVETFLVEVLSLDWAEVHEEAEALEHHLSERLVKAIDRYLGYPKTDPHGHPIPSSDGSVIKRDLRPLDTLLESETATLREVNSDDPERIRRWKDQGFVPGARIRVIRCQPEEEVWLFDVDNREVMTGTKGIAGLFVEKTGS